MIFKPLYEAARRGELLLIDGGMCHWHLRRDGQVTIREIIVLPECQRKGIGQEMLDALRRIPGASSVFAKCPADLPANGFYQATGFVWEGTEMTRTGRKLNLWRLTL